MSLQTKGRRSLASASILAGLSLLASLSTVTAVAQDAGGKMTVDDMIRTYDQIEVELLKRFEKQVAESDVQIAETARALSAIQSRKAVPLLLKNIEFVVGESGNKRVGDFYPVRIVGASTYRDVYISLKTLIAIGGIPLDKCLAEVEKAKDRSLRETLLINLGQACFGRVFTLVVHDKAAKPERKEKWERVLSLLPKD